MEEDFLDYIEKEYNKFKKKHNLPDFKKLDEDFDIAKITEHETFTLLRDIRKAMIEKLISYLRFTELFINPSNAPMFFMFLVKNLKMDEKKLIEEIYAKLGEYEIDAIELDIEYSEKKEAEFIRDVFKEWQTLKKQLLKITCSLKKNWKQKSDKKEKSYC